MNNMPARDEQGPERHQPLRVDLYDIVFALNLASAFAYALRVCVINRIGSTLPDDLGYFFLRAAARINHALLLSLVPPVSTLDVERHLPGIREQVGRELVLLVSVSAATTIVYLLLRMIAGTRLHQVIATRLLGPSLLFAAPLAYLAAMYDTSSGSLRYGVPMLWDVSYRSLTIILGAEGFVMLVSMAKPIRSVPAWLFAALWLLHLGFWVPVLWSTFPTWEVGPEYGFFVPCALLIGWVVLSLMWALRLRRTEPGMPEARTPSTAWAVLAGATATAICAFIWLPHPVRSVADPAHRDSVTIELSRGPCFGMCAPYSVLVHGNGAVEYTGDLHGKPGTATATLSAEQVTAILQKLDSVGFFALEDTEIDDIIGARRWVK